MGDLSGRADALQGATGLLFCLGGYSGAAPDALLRRITVDFAVAAGRALEAASPVENSDIQAIVARSGLAGG